MSKFGRSLIDYARTNMPYFGGTTQATPLSTPAYWNQIYKKLKGENFEWAVEPTSLIPTYQSTPGTTHSLLTPGKWLVIGNGTSDLPRLMSSVGGGEVNVTACDFSDTVVEQMKKKQTEVEWVRMDCTEDMGDSEYDGIIDKGLLDGLHLARDTSGVKNVLSNAYRSLLPGGSLFTASYSKGKYLIPILNGGGRGGGAWSKVETRELETVYLHQLIKGGEGGGTGGNNSIRRRRRHNSHHRRRK